MIDNIRIIIEYLRVKRMYNTYIRMHDKYLSNGCQKPYEAACLSFYVAAFFNAIKLIYMTILNKISGLIRAINDFVRSTGEREEIEQEQKSVQQMMIQ